MTNFTDGIRVGLAPQFGITRPGVAGANEYQGGIPKISDNILPPPGLGAFMSPIFVMSYIPLTLQANNLVVAARPTSAATLVAGTGVTLGTIAGTTAYILDVARNISFTTLGDESSITITVTGWDWYLQPQTSAQTLPASATKGVTTKTFKAISAISVSAQPAANITVGTDDTFGLVYSLTDKTLLIPKWNNTVAIDTSTVVVADATTATASTGDVRGTVKPSSGASDGVKRLTVWQTIINPDTTSGLIGVVPA